MNNKSKIKYGVLLIIMVLGIVYFYPISFDKIVDKDNVLGKIDSISIIKIPISVYDEAQEYSINSQEDIDILLEEIAKTKLVRTLPVINKTKIYDDDIYLVSFLNEKKQRIMDVSTMPKSGDVHISIMLADEKSGLMGKEKIYKTINFESFLAALQKTEKTK